MEIDIRRSTSGNFFQVNYVDDRTNIDIGFLNLEELKALREYLLGVADDIFGYFPMEMQKEIEERG